MCGVPKENEVQTRQPWEHVQRDWQPAIFGTSVLRCRFGGAEGTNERPRSHFRGGVSRRLMSQQVQYIGKVVDIPVVRGKWRLLLSRESLCVREARDVRTELVHG